MLLRSLDPLTGSGFVRPSLRRRTDRVFGSFDFRIVCWSRTMDSPPPVHHLVVMSHPDPDSFCGAVARRWQERVRHHHQDCDLRDLYRDNFDPVLKANEQPGKEGYAPRPENVAEREHLEKLDVLTFVYPVWFGTPPARSEENTSELQSLMRISYAVFCLKKNN